MTNYDNAIRSIKPTDAAKNAAKHTSWGGYVYKTTNGLTEQEIAAGKYRLNFVRRNGDQYVFLWDGRADFAYAGFIENDDGALGTGSPVPGTTLAYDADLLEATVDTQWDVGAQELYEARRTGGGVW